MDFWTVANLVWMSGKAMHCQNEELSKLAKSMPTELQNIHARGSSLSISLYRLGEVLRDDKVRVLEPDHPSNKDILQTAEKVEMALSRVMHGIYKLGHTPEPRFWDAFWSCCGYPSEIEEWHTKKQRLVSETEEINFVVGNIHRVVTAGTARNAGEVLNRLERLEEWLKRAPFKRFSTKASEPSLAIPQTSRSAREGEESPRDVVRDLCKKNESYCWYRFLNDTKAVILLRDIADKRKILAFFVWYVGIGEKARFYKVDRARPFLTCPGFHRNEVAVFVSREDGSTINRVTLNFDSRKGKYIPLSRPLGPVLTVFPDANGLREVMDDHKKVFAGYVSGVEHRGVTSSRYQPVNGFAPSRSHPDINYFAEVLDLNTVPCTTRVLQLWPRRGSDFVIETHPIYIHKVSGQATYEVNDRTLRLRGATMTRTKNETSHLRRRFDRKHNELQGHFKIEFETSTDALEVYNLLNLPGDNDDDDDDWQNNVRIVCAEF